ncbi:hypothetical protein SDRG_04966 [Saprolegnia diclina VS20]|uniref:Uncharacterized protein n=1 Tax=Saprolegnia diclina (strain VS20) TaxID=1156394 RepID=T0QIZ6_SAPDV|nr:hypothetical protein SDRG_04966 [Saprolegnia diclina VS20]EQC37949.1 hypothetical protein SDRG_04966 [Saprolegnia diclina VS20]|eukprot:XP_008608882.1 hypothetical protein SDRG_04966 [Saprolegnia diclina VS20]
MKLACLVLGPALLDATLALANATTLNVDGPRNRTQVRDATTVPSPLPVLRHNNSSRLPPNATGRFALVRTTSAGNHSTVVSLNATTAEPLPSHANDSSSLLVFGANATADDDVIVAPSTTKRNSTTSVTTASHAAGTNGVAALIALVVTLGLA